MRLEVVEVHLPVAGDQRLAPVERRDRFGRRRVVRALGGRRNFGITPSTATPGSVLPSRYSSDAPPPVEMWPNAFSSRPSARTAAAESPPPTTDSPSTAATASATPGCRPRTARPRTRPSGRSRTPSARPASAAANAATVSGRCRGPSARPGSRRPRTVSVSASSLISARHDDVGRQHDLVAVLGEEPLAVVDLVVLEQRVADLVALRLEEGEAHPAADEQPVDLGQQRLDDRELVADLRPAEHDDVRAASASPVSSLQHLQLVAHEVAAVVRQQRGDVVDRGVLAVHRAERVLDERAAVVLAAGEELEAARELVPLVRRPCSSRPG